MSLSRRDFLKATGAMIGTGLLAACGVNPNSVGGNTQVQKDQPENKNIIPATGEFEKNKLPNPNFLEMYASAGFGEAITEMANGFVNFEANSNERFAAENELMETLGKMSPKIGDILKATNVCITPDCRARGLQMIFDQAQNGELEKYGIEPMSQEMVDWAINNEIDPRTLLIARSMYKPMLSMMASCPDIFFETKENLINLSWEDRVNMINNSMPNPGGISRLAMSETRYGEYGLSNIGDVPAIDNVNTNPDYFPSAEDDLNWIALKLREFTGVNFNERNIPGSKWMNYDDVVNGSGGAIGPQFMPINLRLMMSKWEEANNRMGNCFSAPNPFGPFEMVGMMYLYISSEWYGRHPDINSKSWIVREGYERGNEEKIMNAFMKWNAYEPEATAAMNSAVSYWNEFVDTK